MEETRFCRCHSIKAHYNKNIGSNPRRAGGVHLWKRSWFVEREH